MRTIVRALIFFASSCFYMKIKSLVKVKDKFCPIEVEISLVPGLPVIQFLGLPDRVIQESSQRIKSAVQSQGFAFPKAQQVIVNLYPSELKKNSVGIELAVALGILVVTDQVSASLLKDYFIYGQLRLNGEVKAPEDMNDLKRTPNLLPLLTGFSDRDHVISRFEISELKQISMPVFKEGSHLDLNFERPTNYRDLEVGRDQAELIKILALGEHSCLLAGPSGSGKTTLAKIVHELLEVPRDMDVEDILINNDIAYDCKSLWRPLVQPHHNISSSGLIGGGVPIVKGELFRAHGGMLILDELLEFSPSVLESLREPLEEGIIRLRKSRYRETHRANIMSCATSNLCPCGDWTPENPVICGRSLGKCRSYLNKLSGPIVDRFQVVFFTKGKLSLDTVHIKSVFEDVLKVREFRKCLAQEKSEFLKVSKNWSLDDLKPYLPSFYMKELFPKELSSRRRLLSTLQVARTLADINSRIEITPADIEKAMLYSMRPFDKLKRLNS